MVIPYKVATPKTIQRASSSSTTIIGNSKDISLATSSASILSISSKLSITVTKATKPNQVTNNIGHTLTSKKSYQPNPTNLGINSTSPSNTKTNEVLELEMFPSIQMKLDHNQKDLNNLKCQNRPINKEIKRPTTTKQPPPETHHVKQSSPLPPDESSPANNNPTCNPNIALCDVGWDAQPELEQPQTHSSTKYNKGKDGKQSNTTSIDTTRANPRANHSGILSYPPLSHNTLQPKLTTPQAYTPTELLCQLLLKTNTGHA
ncbi:hypothetical protein H5410_022832 [Solanum commersonii]|uniref:Uncharacterized protein n=1 Tax=Solanum commersonii TaxID=4109 RepID=A0A9J5ZHX0_SOLCO|nr:hypothetical protein H5410_022832 [Solanum commersonii]